jgi:hypothetical protein
LAIRSRKPSRLRRNDFETTLKELAMQPILLSLMSVSPATRSSCGIRSRSCDGRIRRWGKSLVKFSSGRTTAGQTCSPVGIAPRDEPNAPHGPKSLENRDCEALGSSRGAMTATLAPASPSCGDTNGSGRWTDTAARNPRQLFFWAHFLVPPRLAKRTDTRYQLVPLLN